MNGPTFAPPRPAPDMIVRPPAARPAARPAAAKPDADGGGIRVLTYVRLHWLMILFCGTLLGGGLGAAAWELLASKFESYALLQVSSAPAYIASGNKEQARTDFVTYLKTTAGLIKSEFVLNAALRDLKDVAVVKGQKDPIKYLEEEVVVLADGTEVIRVSYKGRDPGDTKAIVDAVQAAFIREVVGKEVAERQAFREKVKTAVSNLKGQLALKAPPKTQKVTPGVIQAGATGAPATLPGGLQAVPVPPGVEPIDHLLQQFAGPGYVVQQVVSLRQDVLRLPLQLRDADHRLQEVKARMTALEKANADVASVDAADRDPAVVAQAAKLAYAQRRYDTMAGAGDKNAPGVLRLRAEVEAEAQELERVKRAKVVAIEIVRRRPEAEKLVADFMKADTDVKHLTEQLAIAKSLLEKAERQLKEMPLPAKAEVKLAGGVEVKEGTEYDPANTNLLATDEVFRRLVQQEQMVELELQSPPRVTPLQKASAPTQRDVKKQYMGTAAAFLFGFALVTAGVVGFEVVGRRVSSLADLKAVGPAPVVGVIPFTPGQATGRDPVKRAAANEAVDKLRAYVTQTWLARGASTVAVTSATADEGRAFAAFGLASSLAQAGYRTLLVDFDLRSPTLHAYAGVGNDAGVCDILRGEVDPWAAAVGLPSGLTLLPAGRRSDDAHKACVGGRLDALLTRLREPFDVVIVHTHAVLAAAETVEVARRCEAVLVCARYRETKAPLLRTATDRVAAMEIPYSGVVYVGATGREAMC